MMTAEPTLRQEADEVTDELRGFESPDQEPPKGSAVQPSRAGRTSGGRLTLPRAWRGGAPAWTWLGVLVTAAGFVVIAVGWGQVAGETQVYRQLPYVVSAGLAGLGMVMIGLTVLNLTARQRDAIDRDRQLERIARMLQDLRQGDDAPDDVEADD